MKRGLMAPNVAKAIQRASVNIPGEIETIWEPRYDYQTMPNAGATSLTFFQNPVGSLGKTLSDTNMDLSGQIPKGQNFLITGIQVELYPGVPIADAAAPTKFADDIFDFYKTGALVLRIGSKEYVRQGNLLKFAPVNRLDVNAALATGNAVDAQSQYASACGREYTVVDLLLTSNQNFSVELRDLPALPSGADARVGVTLNGYLMRNAQ